MPRTTCFHHCKCGVSFAARRELTEHVGLQNPHWPRVKEDDEHRQVIEPRPMQVIEE